VDVTAPVITLVGDDPLVVSVGGVFVDPGASAFDDVDGDVSGSIVVDASGVDTSVAGSYVVTYSVSDAAGNVASVSRTVEVVEAPPPPPSGGSLEVRIGASGDDVEEMGDGWLYVGSSDLELTEDPDRQTVGLRFTGVEVPRGAVVTAAWVQFTVDERSSEATDLDIWVIDEGNAVPFGGRRGVSSRPLAGVSVRWGPPAWSVVGAAGAEQRTPDLAGLVQAVVDRPDWGSGQALALVITGTGRRVAESYDGTPTAAPLLHIEYTIP
jgi:hypothetical protein